MSSSTESAADYLARTLGESGEQINRRVDEATKKIEAAVDEKIGQVAAKIREGQEELARQRQALKGLGEKIDNKAGLAEFNALRDRVTRGGLILAGAMDDTNTAAQTDDPQQAKQAVDKAAEKAEKADDLLTQISQEVSKLAQSVSTLQAWKEQTVDPTLSSLSAHRTQVDDQLNRHEEILQRAGLIDNPHFMERLFREDSEEDQSETRRTIVERFNPSNWGWIAWIGAGIGVFIALAIALAWVCPSVSHVLNWVWPWLRQLLSFLAGVALTAIGFFGGGLLGDMLAKKLEKRNANA